MDPNAKTKVSKAKAQKGKTATPADQANEAAGKISAEGARPSASDTPQLTGAAGTNSTDDVKKQSDQGGAGNTAGSAGGSGAVEKAETRQSFSVASTVLLDGKSFAVGKTIALTRGLYNELKPAGVIDGEWKD